MNKNEAPGTAKKGLFRVVFSRTGIILILLLLQYPFIGSGIISHIFMER